MREEALNSAIWTPAIMLRRTNSIRKFLLHTHCSEGQYLHGLSNRNTTLLCRDLLLAHGFIMSLHGEKSCMME